MARTAAFRSFVRLMTAALLADRRRCSVVDAVGMLREQTQNTPAISRRRFLFGAGATGTTLALGDDHGLSASYHRCRPLSSSLSVGIVGAGLAGLACADTLKTRGVRASIYEATTRAGGRCRSLRGFFPGQVAECGGELIDTSHTTILGYAERFGLVLEDDHDQPGEIVYHFLGQRHSECSDHGRISRFLVDQQVEEYLNRLSLKVSALSHTPDDVALDRTNLLAYLRRTNGAGAPAGPVAKAAVLAAYEAEYGLAAADQSCLNFLLFVHSEPRSTLTPFSVFSDKRFHLADGNDRIVEETDARSRRTNFL